MNDMGEQLTTGALNFQLISSLKELEGQMALEPSHVLLHGFQLI